MIAPLIALINAEPGMAQRILAVHVDDNTGRCTGCVQHDRPAAAHPCVIRSHALHALAIQKAAIQKADRYDSRPRLGA